MLKFKIGYKVICVDDSYSKLLSKNKKYTISGIIDSNYVKEKYLTLKEFNDDKHFRFGSNRFIIDLIGTRKEKLENLCLKEETK